MPDPHRPLSQGKITALKLLKEALADAEDAGHDRWQFAIRKDALLAAGSSASDLRWLLSSRLIEEAIEITALKSSERVFRAAPPLALPADGCFVLTYGGVVYVESHILGAKGSATAGGEPTPRPRAARRRTRRRSRPLKPSDEPPSDSQESLAEAPRPQWHPLEGDLYFRGRLVRRCGRKTAKIEERLLEAFADATWNRRVANPFGHRLEDRQQLKEAVRRLNTSLRGALLRFHVRRDGAIAYWQDCTLKRSVQ
jgi:hypothetical protein